MSKSIRNITVGITAFILVFILSAFTAFAQEEGSVLNSPELAVSAHTTKSITLVWSEHEADSVSGYEIASVKNDEYTVLAQTDAQTTTYTVSDLTAGNVYHFAVRSYVDAEETGERTYSEYSKAVECAATPTAPKIGSVTRNVTTLSVPFSSTNCTSYQLRYSTKSDMSGAKTISVKKSAKSVSIKSLASSTKYYIQMRSIVTLPKTKEKVYSSWSSKANQVTKPSKMVISSISTPSTTTVKASWKTVKSTGYQLQYSLKSDFSSKKTISLTKGTKTKTLSKLKTGKTYYVRIRAYVKHNGANVYGSWSNKKKQKIYTAKKLTVAAKLMKSGKWSSKTLSSVKKGASVRYISKSGRWYKVIYGGKTGYIYNLAFKKAGSSNLSRSKVTAKNYKIYLDDVIFFAGKNRKSLFDYVVNHMSYSYSKISSAQRKANINSLAKVKANEAELAAVAIRNRGGICYNFAAYTKTLLERAGFDVQYIFGSNKNGTHCWVLINTPDGYRHLDAVRNAYLFTDKQMRSSSKTKDFRWNKNKYPACN